MVDAHPHDPRRRRSLLTSAALIAALVAAFIAPTVASAGTFQGAIVPSPNAMGAAAWSIVTSPNTSTTQQNLFNGVSCVSSSDCWAVGAYYTGSYYQTLVEEWNGTSWSIVTSPNTSTTQTNDLIGVSCVSSTDCWAVGYYSNGTAQTLIEQWSGTSWSIVTSPNTSTTQSNGLQGVSCASSSDCMAVGDYQNSSSYEQTLIEQWNGTSWSIVTSPNTSTTQNNQLYGVSCTSLSFCMAVGLAFTNTLVEEWNGTSWSIVGSVDGVSGTSNYLEGVTCTSASFCVAAGIFATGGTSYWETLIEQWNGTSWTLDTSPNSGGQNYLYGVSCTSTSFCVATGYGQFGTTYWQTLVEEWNGSSWSIVTSPNTSTTENNYLYGVSCVSSSDCWAVGDYGGAIQTLIEQLAPATQNNQLNSVSCVSSSDCWAVGYYSTNTGSYNQTLIEEWNGTGWSIVTSPDTSTTQNNVLQGVSCTSATSCMAAGWYSNGSYDQTLIEEWNGTGWSIVTSPSTSTAAYNYLEGVTCVSASDCWAVGFYYNGAYQTLIEQWNGTSWGIVTSPNPGAGDYLYGVTCVSSSDCWAVGIYDTGSGTVDQTAILSYNGTSWGIVSSPNATTSANNVFRGVSCTSSSDCMAVGYYSNGSYWQTLIEQWNGTSWSIVTSPNTSTTESNQLIGVSCVSSSDCMAVGYLTGTYNQTLVEEWNGTSWSIVTSPNTSTTASNILYGVSCASSSDCMAVGDYTGSSSYWQTLLEQFTMVCSGGSLSITTPSSATFPGVTLNGSNQTSTTSLTFTPDDETGTGSGWNINITSTTLTNGASDTLPTTASAVTGVASVVADTGNCSLPTNTISPYPITIPAAATPPTAVPVYSANTGTGEGPANVTLNFGIAVPANAYSGTYSSTWTVVIASGP